MATQVSLVGRGEPADLEIRIIIPVSSLSVSRLPVFRLPGGNKKSRFRQIVLGGNGLHPFPIKPAFERHNGSRVAGKGPVGKGIDLIQRQRHDCLLRLGRYALACASLFHARHCHHRAVVKLHRQSTAV